jgi:hypothetical protein
MNHQKVTIAPAGAARTHNGFGITTAANRIAFYSPDIELCANLRLLFQDEYTLYTTTDPEMLLFIVNLLNPNIMIADAPFTDKMAQRFDDMKRGHPEMRILLFNVSHGHAIAGGTFIPNSRKDLIDAVIYKPVDIAELKTRIQELLPKEKEPIQ